MSHNAKYLFKFSKVVIIFLRKMSGVVVQKTHWTGFKRYILILWCKYFFILALLHKYLGECTYTHALNVIPMKAGKSFEGCSKTMFNYIKI